MEKVYHVRLNEEGRLVIPAPLRKRLGFVPGQEVLLQADPDGLRVYTRESSLRRMQLWVATGVAAGRNLADDLMAERRAEAVKEADE